MLVGVHKNCIGGAVDLFGAADIRYCTEDSKFSIKEVDLAIVPDVGTLQNVPWKIGNDSMFREYVFTGKFFSGQEALTLGLVGKVFKDKPEMLEGLTETASLSAKKSLVAIYGIKKMFIKQNQEKIERDSDYLALLNASLMRTEDVMKSMTGFFTKKDPKFDKIAQKDKTKELMKTAEEILYSKKEK